MKLQLQSSQVDLLAKSEMLDGVAVAGGWGVLPSLDYIGMCGPKGYGFSAVLVINMVWIIAILLPLW